MKTTTLVLDHLLPRESVELGRLVTNILNPAQDYYPKEQLLLPKHATTVHEIQNLDVILKNSTGSNLSAFLTAFLTGSWTQSRETTTHITTPSFVTHQLSNCEDALRTTSKMPLVRTWIEQAARRKQRVYIITGLKVVKDAHIRQGIVQSSNLGVIVQVPGSVITSAAGVGPISFVDDALNVGGGKNIHSDSSEKAEYVAAGEHIFAVQYRKVQIKTFSSRNLDPTYVLKGSKWKTYIATRGTSADEDDTFMAVDVGDPLDTDDIKRPYEKFELDDEDILFCPPPVRKGLQ